MHTILNTPELVKITTATQINGIPTLIIGCRVTRSFEVINSTRLQAVAHGGIKGRKLTLPAALAIQRDFTLTHSAPRMTHEKFRATRIRPPGKHHRRARMNIIESLRADAVELRF